MKFGVGGKRKGTGKKREGEGGRLGWRKAQEKRNNAFSLSAAASFSRFSPSSLLSPPFNSG